MNGERRNDIGNKVLISVVAILVIIIMGFAIDVAGKANEKVNVNTVAIGGMKVEQRHTREAIESIKDDIKEIRNAVVK